MPRGSIQRIYANEYSWDENAYPAGTASLVNPMGMIDNNPDTYGTVVLNNVQVGFLSRVKLWNNNWTAAAQEPHNGNFVLYIKWRVVWSDAHTLLTLKTDSFPGTLLYPPGQISYPYSTNEYLNYYITPDPRVSSTSSYVDIRSYLLTEVLEAQFNNDAYSQTAEVRIYEAYLEYDSALPSSQGVVIL